MLSVSKRPRTILRFDCIVACQLQPGPAALYSLAHSLTIDRMMMKMMMMMMMMMMMIVPNINLTNLFILNFALLTLNLRVDLKRIPVIMVII